MSAVAKRQNPQSPAVRLCGDLSVHPAHSVADKRFARGQWNEALADYRQLLHVPGSAASECSGVRCRIGWCLYYLGRFHEAIEMIRGSGADDWHHSYLVARLARALRKPDMALALLARLAQRFPDQGLIRRDLAYAVYSELADVAGGRSLWRPLLGTSQFGASAGRHQVFSNYYEPDPRDPDNRAAMADYIVRYIQPPEGLVCASPNPSSRRRRRVGLISVFFHGSPVYPLTIGALRSWATGVDLIFIDRGKTAEDVATGAFRSLAVEWHTLRGLAPEVLEKRLRALKLDALIDMSGWSDIAALRALARKPAPRLYKWVGGQADSTGIAAFDGFIGDPCQSPTELSALYAEPLINLPGGYATYSAPDYLPAAQAPRPASAGSAPLVGIISNPIKLSTGFLGQLRDAAAREPAPCPARLRFIGNRYRHPLVQDRLRKQIDPRGDTPLSIEFLAPQGHENYLKAVAELDWVVDTWPYTGGLTILEALAVGVPCRTRAGRLFCQRHGYGHARYAGLADAEIDLDRLGPFTHSAAARRKNGVTLLAADSPRRDHIRLASALDAVISGHLPS